VGTGEGGWGLGREGREWRGREGTGEGWWGLEREGGDWRGRVGTGGWGLIMLPGLLLVVKYLARTAEPGEYWKLWAGSGYLPGLRLVVKHLARTAEHGESGELWAGSGYL
jgi:hypothetical protein